MRGTTYLVAALNIASGVLAYPSQTHSEQPIGADVPQAPAVAASLQDIATVGYATQNGGTKGGKGGKVVHVSTFDQLSQAALGDAPAIVVISGKIQGADRIRSGSNKSFIGKDATAELIGIGFFVRRQKNIIIRNIKISKVLAKNGDAIGTQETTNVWIDHVDLSSDQDHGKDFYDGLIDLTHASDFMTVSNSKIHDHFKASLIGHSNNNEAQDKSHLKVTMHNNLWQNIHSRTPSLRFGTAHIFDSVFLNVVDGINVRKGAQALVEDNAFTNSTKPLYTVDSTGGAVSKGNDFGQTKVVELAGGKLAAVPYKYQALPATQMKETVMKVAGNTLRF